MNSFFSRCTPRQAASILLCGAGVTTLVLTGCVSTDATSDVQRASSLVGERSGVAPEWLESSWDASTAWMWDGASDLGASQAVRVALANNRDVRAAVTDIAASRAAFAQEHLLPNPVINLSYGLVTDGAGGSPMGAGIVSQFAWLLTRDDAIGAATAELDATVFRVSDASLALVADVRAAHARVLFAERSMVLHRENADVTSRSLRLAESRFAAGESSRLDVNRAALAHERALIALADQDARLASYRRTLLHLLGRADASDAWSTDDVVGDIVDKALAHSEVDATRIAMAQNLKIASALARIDASAARLGIAKNSQFRNIRAGLDYRENFADRPAFFPTLSFELPIFDDARARNAAATAQLERTFIEAAAARDAVVAEARTQWIALHSESAALRAYDDSILALSSRTLELAQSSFRVGESSITVVLDAQREHIRARLERMTRAEKQVLAAIALEQALGGSLERIDHTDTSTDTTMEGFDHAHTSN